jgi:CRP-like cAMP-binding protein
LTFSFFLPRRFLLLLARKKNKGKAADYFVLILEGRVEVTVGKESLVFESGPFSHFGSSALLGGVFALGDELGKLSSKIHIHVFKSPLYIITMLLRDFFVI